MWTKKGKTSLSLIFSPNAGHENTAFDNVGVRNKENMGFATQGRTFLCQSALEQ